MKLLWTLVDFLRLYDGQKLVIFIETKGVCGLTDRGFIIAVMFHGGAMA